MNESKIDFTKPNYDASSEDRLRILDLYYLRLTDRDSTATSSTPSKN